MLNYQRVFPKKMEVAEVGKIIKICGKTYSNSGELLFYLLGGLLQIGKLKSSCVNQQFHVVLIPSFGSVVPVLNPFIESLQQLQMGLP